MDYYDGKPVSPEEFRRLHKPNPAVPITEASLGLPPEVKTLDWLRDKVVDLFVDASSPGEKDHGVCVKYAEILMKLLPGNRGAGTSGNSHPDAAVIEQVRLAIQQTTHPAPKSQTEP